MKAFVEKLKSVERDLSAQEGPFLLFALFLREDPADFWDLLVSSPWVERNKGKALRLIASKLQDVAAPDELEKLSRIVIIEDATPALAAIQSAISIEHGLAEIKDSTFNGLRIKHAYVITSRRQTTSV